MDSRGIILSKVMYERDRQDRLWGSERKYNNAWWNVIASEENGEVAREVYEQNEEKLLVELVQACAVYFAWAEALVQRGVHDSLRGNNEKNG
jgi:hypothetical protein